MRIQRRNTLQKTRRMRSGKTRRDQRRKTMQRLNKRRKVAEEGED